MTQLICHDLGTVQYSNVALTELADASRPFLVHVLANRFDHIDGAVTAPSKLHIGVSDPQPNDNAPRTVPDELLVQYRVIDAHGELRSWGSTYTAAGSHYIPFAYQALQNGTTAADNRIIRLPPDHEVTIEVKVRDNAGNWSEPPLRLPMTIVFHLPPACMFGCERDPGMNHYDLATTTLHEFYVNGSDRRMMNASFRWDLGLHPQSMMPRDLSIAISEGNVRSEMSLAGRNCDKDGMNWYDITNTDVYCPDTDTANNRAHQYEDLGYGRESNCYADYYPRFSEITVDHVTEHNTEWELRDSSGATENGTHNVLDGDEAYSIAEYVQSPRFLIGGRLYDWRTATIRFGGIIRYPGTRYVFAQRDGRDTRWKLRSGEGIFWSARDWTLRDYIRTIAIQRQPARLTADYETMNTAVSVEHLGSCATTDIQHWSVE